MPDLISTQRAFAAAVRDRSAELRAACLFVGDDALAARRIAVYRRNAVAGAAKALTAAFPVAVQVVGAEFFEGMARRYWESEPSRSGDLNEYGGQFANFVASFPPAAELPYLPDLIRLEWHVHRAYCAQDPVPFDVSRLADVAPEDQGRLSIGLLPGTALLSSDYPIAQIWQLHQGGPEFDIDWSVGESVLVLRRGLSVEVKGLSPAQFAFYQALAAGQVLEAAAGAALTVDESADLPGILSELFAFGPVATASISSS